mgnify:CR=1 FL=1
MHVTTCYLHFPCHGYNLNISKKIIDRLELENEVIQKLDISLAEGNLH